MQFSVQLYSLRDLVTDGASFLALFPQLKALGFDGVEFAGYHGLPAEEIRAALDKAGLTATGCHMGLGDLKPEKLPETIAFCKVLGMDKIGIGGAPHGTPEETAATCAVLQAAYDEGQRQGVTIYYHNHSGEFEPFPDGSLAIDRFRVACALQIDTYWSFCAGVDNYQFITENQDRICSLHIKDGVACHPKALGEGECDLAAVVRAAKDIGLGWLVLENDEPEPDGLTDVARSIQWLKANA
ncbi:MAG: sugar phosphate isomerase/epimerase [Oscillospiraceae bacterium]|jgi:sugar phosphate isomerase/epimerase|nr:sugar phosphate isomerase/epimerase [Oscillospiraceae bacterium]